MVRAAAHAAARKAGQDQRSDSAARLNRGQAHFNPFDETSWDSRPARIGAQVLALGNFDQQFLKSP